MLYRENVDLERDMLRIGSKEVSGAAADSADSVSSIYTVNTVSSILTVNALSSIVTVNTVSNTKVESTVSTVSNTKMKSTVSTVSSTKMKSTVSTVRSTRMKSTVKRIECYFEEATRVQSREASGTSVRKSPQYTDSDWGGCKDTRKSTSGHVVMIGGGPVR